MNQKKKYLRSPAKPHGWSTILTSSGGPVIPRHFAASINRLAHGPEARVLIMDSRGPRHKKLKTVGTSDEPTELIN